MGFSYTADIMNKVPSVYTHSMESIYLSLSAQVAEGTVFRKLLVSKSYVNMSHVIPLQICNKDKTLRHKIDRVFETTLG